MCSGAYGRTPSSLPLDIIPAYWHALPQELALLAETLAVLHYEVTTRYMLADAAALKGHPSLGDVFQGLDVAMSRSRSNPEPQLKKKHA